MRAVLQAPHPSAQRHRAENFPVASLLCPPRLRPPILAIYRFARYGDDLADEGNAPAARRQQALHELGQALREAAAGRPPPPELVAVVRPLAAVLHDWALPIELPLALLSAFEQDTRLSAYATRADLLDYCRRSADPVGRMLLHLAGVHEEAALRASDAVCSGLQLVNFWQDLGVDRLKGRVYVPAEDLARHGLCAADLLAGRDSPALRAAVAAVNAWARELLERGRNLPARVPGRLGWELRLVIEGGLRVAERIAAMDHATLLARPRLRAWDAPLLLLRALRHAR